MAKETGKGGRTDGRKEQRKEQRKGQERKGCGIGKVLAVKWSNDTISIGGERTREEGGEGRGLTFDWIRGVEDK
jgi:hypothetical protein